MKSMFVPVLRCAWLLALPLSCLLQAVAPDPVTVYKSADYKSAIPLLREAVKASPGDSALQAALLSSLVYQDDLDGAADLAQQLEGAFPNSPEVLCARGEWAFYLGDMPKAEALFRSALKIKDANARAYFGLSRLYRSASFFRTARLFCLKAHELDPDDALITQVWLRYVPDEKREELIGNFAAAHPWLYSHYQEEVDSASALRSAVEQKKVFEVEGGPQESTQHLTTLLFDPRHIRGVGLSFRLNNGRPLNLLLDTGASGIVLKQGAVDKAELNHLGKFESWGIGDKGTRSTFYAVAESCQIGTLRFKTCLVHALEGKGRIAGDEDGLIGADVFANYLISLDFQRLTMHLVPLAIRPPNNQGYDRKVPPDEKGFSPVYRFGNHLYLSTRVNGKSTGLFLIDTGSHLSNIDSTFALQSTKLHGNDWVRIRGVSGQVEKVFEADNAEIEFSHFRQKNLGITAFDLNKAPEHQDVRLSGILGLTVLGMFRMTLDYQNGLVNLDYVK